MDQIPGLQLVYKRCIGGSMKLKDGLLALGWTALFVLFAVLFGFMLRACSISFSEIGNGW